MILRWFDSGTHQQARDEEQARDQARVRARGDGEPDRWLVQRVVQHERVDDSAQGRTRGDDRHGERASLLEVLREDGDARDVEHSGSNPGGDTLAEEDLVGVSGGWISGAKYSRTW